MRLYTTSEQRSVSTMTLESEDGRWIFDGLAHIGFCFHSACNLDFAQLNEKKICTNVHERLGSV